MRTFDSVDRAWKRRGDRKRVSAELVEDVSRDLYLASIRSGCLETAPGLSAQDTRESRLKIVLLLARDVFPELADAISELPSPHDWTSLPVSTGLEKRETIECSGSISMATNGTLRGVSSEYQCGPHFHELETAINRSILSYGGPHLRIESSQIGERVVFKEQRDHFLLIYDKSYADKIGYEEIADVIHSGDWNSINFASADAAFVVSLILASRGFESPADVDFAETPCYGFVRRTIETVFHGIVNDNAMVWDSGLAFRSDADGTKRLVPWTCEASVDQDGHVRTTSLWNLARPTVNYRNGDKIDLRPDGSFSRFSRDCYKIVEGRDEEELGKTLFEKIGWKFQVCRDKRGLSVYAPKSAAAFSVLESELGEECRRVHAPVFRGHARQKVFIFFNSMARLGFDKLR